LYYQVQPNSLLLLKRQQKQFKEEVGRLAKNLASLNAIYGNMLSAMNQPRV